MIGLKEMKGSFFDAPKVVRAVDAATRKVLSKFGAYVRTAAKSSIRTRKRTSAPGEPPSGHTNRFGSSPLKRFLYFGYDTNKRSVVIGPALINQVSTNSAFTSRHAATEILEYGGTLSVVEVQIGGKWFRHDLRSSNRWNRPLRRRNITIAARPFMQPALQKELPKLPAMWANSVKP